jgi:hypothetical protein
MVSFTSPLLLLGLLALPLLWILLRAVPPAAIRRRFAGVALLLGLQDKTQQADKTPWWLLVLRMLALAAVIVGFAGPVVNPKAGVKVSDPLLIIFDGGWADAYDWPQRQAKAASLLDGAALDGRAVALVQLADTPQALTFKAASDWRGRLAAMAPRGWQPQDVALWGDALPEGPFDTAWISDGLAHSGQAELLASVQERGRVDVFASNRPTYALGPAVQTDSKVTLSVQRLSQGSPAAIDVVALGPDPSGVARDLARVKVTFGPQDTAAPAELDLPAELRNRVTRFVLDGQRSAGAVTLAGDTLKRRKVALVSDTAEGEAMQLLSPVQYLRQAMNASTDVLTGSLGDVLPTNPDVIVLADVAQMPQPQAKALQAWVEKGGLLLRFAGPRLAASDMARLAEDPLMPLTLRQGGLTSGGAMSWGAPKALADFAQSSPFHGLSVPPDLKVRTQVLAQPDADLPARTLAALDDGTPLVTRKALGQGQVVLFHVTANAEWSDLPLSGLFVQMLERLAVSATSGSVGADVLAGLVWTPEHILNGWGDLADPTALAGLAGEDLVKALQAGPSSKVPAGVYRHDGLGVALNAVPVDAPLVKATWPVGVAVQGLTLPAEIALKGPVLALALILLLLDGVATLAVSGRLGFARRTGAIFLALALLAHPQDAQANDAADQRAIAATQGVVLAYVMTGDPAVDATSAAGLQGLSDQLIYRTAIEPLAPMGVDVERDEVVFFPLLYWPITADTATPSPAAYDKLNHYLRTGGMILLDTRDADMAGAGPTPEGQALQRIAQGLDIPPLATLPDDHVLTRSFYLLQTFPGRFVEGGLWVEAPPPDAAKTDGMPFRNLNDGVTPVVIGGNDWASAWAVDDNGWPLLPVGRGAAGDQQREYAYRFGINLIMYVLTGNYKSDQVHVPALLERLGK